MALKAGPSVLRQLRFAVASWKEDPRTDAELLRRFVQARDEGAFETLVGRHGELVWGVCLRVLRNAADAEDALQATFLRLARDADRIVSREALPGWLFRVARDCSIDLRRAIERRKRMEGRLTELAARSADAPGGDLRLLLDDELAQLPAAERAVLVLVSLEGRTYAEAALELGCSVAAAHRRLVRAQTRLRRRLARRAPAASAVLAAVISGAAGAATAAASPPPPVVLARTVESGLVVARTGILPPTPAGLLAATAATRAPTAVAAGAGVALLVGCLFAAVRPDPEPAAPPPAAPAREETEFPGAGTAIGGVVRDPGGRPVAGAEVSALARRPFSPGERGLRDEVLVAATTDAAGRFTLRVPADFDTWFAGRVVTLRASAAGLAPATLSIRLGADPGAVEVRLGEASPLRGRLRDEAGGPAAGVRLSVVRVGDAVAEPVVGSEPSRPASWPEDVTTGADGTFAIPALGGTENVWVRVVDERFALDTFRIDGPGPREFRLAPARPLAVEVVAADTGEPLGGARVTVITDRVPSHPHFCATPHGVLGPRVVPADIDAVTDDHGRFRIGLAPGDGAELLVHPPARSGPYVGIRVRAEAGGTRVVRLPRGRWLTGFVTDAATGRPLENAAVHWGREAATRPEWRDEVLVGRDAITRTGPDGTFQLAVLPGACSVRVYGPTADYAAVRTPVPGATNTTLFAHHVERVEVPQRGDVPPVRVMLRTAPRVVGAVEPAPAGGAAFLLASGRVSPVRGYAALPLPVDGGEFSLPGCRAGHTTRAYLLDPVARVGGVVDAAPDGPRPVARLRPCGAIRFRIVGPDGAPQPGIDVHASLLVERDRPSASDDEPAADPQPVEWFDAVNYPVRPKPGATGVVELGALIPGARYSLTVGSGANKVAVGTLTVEAGKTHALPDVVLPAAQSGGP